MTQLFNFYQLPNDKTWNRCNSEFAEKVKLEVKPQYMTVLASTQDVSRSNDFAGELLYRDDCMYFDFDDKENVEFAIKQSVKFIECELMTRGVNPNAIRIYATGSKGIHIELPAGIYTDAIDELQPHLPATFAEVAHTIYVESLDTRVYTGGQRMWRVPNVKRENGAYKVPISWTELQSLTSANYAEMCSAPRPFPPIEPPILSRTMLALYCKASEAAEMIQKKRPKAKQPLTAAEIRKTTPDRLKYEVVKRSLAVAEVIDALCIEGSWCGDHFKGKNPTRADDRSPRSFIIFADGSWKEFALDNVGGGDLISLWAYCNDCDQSFALMKLTSPKIDLNAEVSKLLASAYKEQASANDARDMSLDWLMKQEFVPPRTIIANLLYGGLTILAGAPKSGKSWIGLDVGLCVAAGTRALNGQIPERCGVLYITPDDPNLARLQRRVVEVLQVRGIRDIPANFHIRTEWPRIGSGGVEVLGEFLDAHRGIGVVIMDCLAHMMPAIQKGADRYAAELQALASLRRLLNDKQVAGLITHHTRKGKSDDIFDSTSGTNGINGGADTIAILVRVRGTDQATLTFAGRDMEDADLGLSRETGVWQVVGTASDVRQTQARKEVLDALMRAGGSATAAKLAEAVGKNRTTVLRELKTLEDDRLVSCNSTKSPYVYSLAAHRAAA